MAYSKIILNGETLMDVTSDTVDAGNLLSGKTATKNSGVKVTGNIASKSSSDLTASGATVTVPSGYYSAQASKSVDTMTLPQFLSSTKSGTFINGISQKDTVQYLNIPKGYNSTAQYYQITRRNDVMAGTPTATKGTVSNHSITVTPSVTNTTGYITGGTLTGTGVSVSASELVSGTKSITANGTGIDVTDYASVDVSVTPSFTATLTSSGASANVYVKHNNTKYYTSGDTFSFSAGDTLNIFCMKGDGNYFTVNGATVTGGQNITIDYNWAMPSGNISIALTAQNGSSRVDITANGIPTLITKSITQNGTYDAEDDNADGYSSVTVSVSGGASNVVGGTYTTGNGGSAETITLPYTGSGFPVQVVFSLAEYDSSSTAYNTIHQYGIVYFVVCKSNATTPTYTYDSSGFASRYVRYKSSSTASATTSGNAVMDGGGYYTNYSASSSTWDSFIQINSSTALSVFVSSQSGERGLLPNTDYYYSVVYSS